MKKKTKKSKIKFKTQKTTTVLKNAQLVHTNPSQRQTESTVPCNSSSQRAIQI